jgi:protein arginine kinase
MSGAGVEEKGTGKRKRFIPPWFDGGGPDGDVVISTRIRLARNLSGHRFPAYASIAEKEEIFDKAAESFRGSGSSRRKPVCEFEVINVGRIGKLEQHFLVEERVASISLIKGEGSRGVARDSEGKLSVMINEEDHLRIQGMDSGFRPQELWDMASKADDSIGKALKYAYSPRLGFLTACPTNSGTGLRVSCLAHLPGLVLTKTVDQVLQGASQMGVSTRGFLGEHSDILGNIFQLSNRAAMGLSEAEFIDSTCGTIREIINHERAARERLVKEAKLEISDKISRALGILRNAQMLGFAELLNLTSALRLGISCGLYDGYGVDDLNKIVMLGMPAHLQIYISGLDGAPSDLDIVRADLARSFFEEKRGKARTRSEKPAEKPVKKVRKKKTAANA